MSHNKVEFLANKIRKTDDSILSDYSKDGYSYKCLKRHIMKSVNDSIKSEINTFKKVHGTKFITLSSNNIHEQKTDPYVAELMMHELKKKWNRLLKKKLIQTLFTL